MSGSSAMGTATRLENGHATIRGILCLRHRQQPGPERGKTGIYRVFLKKVLHKREEKMQEKMKMALQKKKNLVYNNKKIVLGA